MKFQRRELRTVSASPVLALVQQPSTNASVLKIAFHSDLGNMAAGDFAVHQIGRLFQPEVAGRNDQRFRGRCWKILAASSESPDEPAIGDRGLGSSVFHFPVVVRRERSRSSEDQREQASHV